MLNKDMQQTIDLIVNNLMEQFEIYASPVPIEDMLHQPPKGFWHEVDVTQLSGSFLSIRHRYSPRMSIARMLARHIISSDWGKTQGLMDILQQTDSEFINILARALIMPESMVNRLSSNSRNPSVISMQFEVPEDDAQQRLLELE
ncbi:MAG: hypothetical protein ACPG7F_07260 [Aggregatilineales bacterium]